MKKTVLFNENDIIKNRYRVQTAIGRGGMGTTYKALDSETGKPVVLKAINMEEVQDWKEVELFQREINVLKNLDHPNIPDYYDNFELTWQKATLLILVMEFIDGDNLHNFIKENGLFSLDEVIDILQKLLKILSYIHGLNPPVIHRDINPKNIIRNTKGEIYLVDFGAVGRIVPDTLAASKTDTFVGTLGYMPPEQIYGKALPCSDIYSLGVTMLYLLTAKEPSSFEMKDLHLNFRKYVTLPGELYAILNRMVEPSSEKRLTSAAQALNLLNKEYLKKTKTYAQPVKTKPIKIDFKNLDETIQAKIKAETEKEARKKKQAKAEEQRLKELEKDRKKRKLLRKIEKNNKTPSRVRIIETDQGPILSVKSVPVWRIIKYVFLKEWYMFIVLMGGGGWVLSIFIEIINEEIFKVEFFPGFAFAAGFFICLSGYLFFATFIKNMKKAKDFNILITGKGNVLIFRKNLNDVLHSCKKESLDINFNNTGYAPGGAGTANESWHTLELISRDFKIRENGFNTLDKQKILQFIKDTGIKSG
ncbi:MAG: protein kinase [Spirochaetales bacterium]|nr:protein kinase [Spirochaetales bacterium]